MNEGKAFNLFEQVTSLDDNGTFLVGQVVDGEVKFRQLTKAGFIEQFGTPLTSYEFTPVLEFGGASTGITYAERSGTILMSTNFAIVHVRIRLSWKGSATGTASIKGIRDVNPNLIIPTSTQTCFVVDAHINQNRHIEAYLGDSFDGRNDTIKLIQFNNGSNTHITDAVFENTTIIEFTMKFMFTLVE